jgi:hypothetical protein
MMRERLKAITSPKTSEASFSNTRLKSLEDSADYHSSAIIVTITNTETVILTVRILMPSDGDDVDEERDFVMRLPQSQSADEIPSGAVIQRPLVAEL